MLQPCRCGHLASEHAPGSGTCMAILESIGAPLMHVCPCERWAPEPKEPFGRRALRAAGMALEIALAGVGIARSSIESWWRERRPASKRTVGISSEWLENLWRNSEDLGEAPPIGRPKGWPSGDRSVRVATSGAPLRPGEVEFRLRDDLGRSPLPQVCSRPAPHRCGKDEPCNGFPRPGLFR